MLLDDLDFLLLDLAAEFKLSLDWFGADVGLVFNRHVPPHTLDELKLAFMELFRRGDAVASMVQRRSRRHSRTFVPTPDEIEAGLRGAFDLVYELTPRGGARWEAEVQADWSLYLESSDGPHFRSCEAQSREYLEYKVEVDRAYRRIEGEPAWKELRPWWPVYWKLLPRGFQVRSRLAKKNSETHISFSSSSFPPWSMDCAPEFHHGPSSLVPRKQRSGVDDHAGEMASWPTEKLWKEIESGTQDRRSFAAACEYAPRVDTDALLRLLHFRSGEVRFAGVRELARRRESAAVSRLTSLVLQQYLPALWALGEITDDRTLPVLEMLLEYSDASGGVSLGTLVRAIARFGDGALPVLEKALASSEYAANSGAVAVLALIQSKKSRALLEGARGAARVERTPESLVKERLHRVALVTSGANNGPLPTDPVQALVTTLTHSDAARRSGAVDLLVEFGARDRLPEVVRLAKDPEWQVRASVAHALQQLGGSRRLLAVLAKDQSPAVRWLAKKPILLHIR